MYDIVGQRFSLIYDIIGKEPKISWVLYGRSYDVVIYDIVGPTIS